MAKTYYGKSTSGHSGSLSDYNNDLSDTTSTAANFNISGNPTAVISFYTNTNIPNLTDWDSGTYTWYFVVATANSNVTLTDVSLLRYSSDFATLRASKSSTVSVLLDTTGQKSSTIVWNDGTQNPAGRASTDRLVLRFTINRTVGHGNQAVDISVNDVTNTRIDTPFTIILRNLTRTITEPLTISHTSTNKLRSKNKLRADAITLTHTSTNRLRNKNRLGSDSLTFIDSVIQEKSMPATVTSTKSFATSFVRRT